MEEFRPKTDQLNKINLYDNLIFGQMYKSIISYRNIIDSGLILMPEYPRHQNYSQSILKRPYDPHSASQSIPNAQTNTN